MQFVESNGDLKKKFEGSSNIFPEQYYDAIRNQYHSSGRKLLKIGG